MKNSSLPPIYAKVAYDIATKIASGELEIGQRFTGRSLMGPQYGVSPETIRRAMRLLDNMEIVATQHNVGYVVLSKERAIEYVGQYKSSKDLRQLKAELQEMVAQREILNEKIKRTVEQIIDLTDRFRDSDPLRTYEFTLAEDSPVVGATIGSLQFRQKTGATIVAIRHSSDIFLSPGADTVLMKGDTLVVACALENLDHVTELLDVLRVNVSSLSK